MLSDTVVIEGEVSLVSQIDGDPSLLSEVDGDPDVILVEGGGQTYPHYRGDYTVTPATSAQVLDTDGKVMDDDVTVQAVAQGSATTPATIITADPTISVSSGGLITATVSKTQQITPTVVEGYVSAGTPGNVGVSGSNTEQLTVQPAQTIHPASTDQSIASGKYLTGNQTFKAVTVTGLTADKILQGNVVKIGDSDDDDRIMSVTGTASGGITPTGTKSITANGTGIDVYSYQYADVAVPNSYSASDEGKVVSNGALVAQTSDTVTANNTYDTTLINSLTVNVSGGSGDGLYKLASGAITNSDVDWTQVTALREGAFTGCTLLTTVGNPVLTNANSNIFKGCTGLTTAELTVSITNPRYWASIFEGCTSLTQTILHLTYAGDVYYAGNYLYRNCSSMTTLILDIPNGNTVKFNFNNMFYGQTALRTLVIKKSTMVTLDGSVNTSSFGGIYSNPSLSTIYVPNSLISTYQTATNWSTLYGLGVTFAKIEGSIYE